MIESGFSLVGQSIKIMNWFTPMWILSAGVALGLILVLLFLGAIFVFSRIPFLNSIGEKKGPFVVSSILLSALIFAAIFWGLMTAYAPVGLRADSTRDLSRLFTAIPDNKDEPAALIGVVLGALASLLVGFGFFRLVSSRRIDEVFSLLREGFLSWIVILCTALTGFAVLGLVLGVFSSFSLVKFVDDPKGMLLSIGRIPYSGARFQEFTLQPTQDDSGGELISFNFKGQNVEVDGREIRYLSFASNQNLQVAAEPITVSLSPQKYFRVPSTSSVQTQVYAKGTVIPNEKISSLYIANRGKNPAQVTMGWYQQPVYPEVALVPWTAATTFSLFVLYLCFSVLTPKITAIGLSTFKTEISQPIFILVLIMGAMFVVGSIYVPYNTLGEDIKMYKDSVLTLLRVLAIFAAIWAASKSVSEEIEGRTALTVLSKPVGRRQFILGKIFGISSAMAFLFLLLGVWFFFWTAYKPVYDSVEMAAGDTDWSNCYHEATHIVPALALAFLEVVIFVSISVAISTRMGMLGNLMICFSIYVLGHLTPLIVMSNQIAGAFDTVKFFGQFVSIVFPVLNHFDVQTAINTNSDVPWIYLGWSVVYTFLYGSAAVLLALVMFEDRDLA